MKKHVHCSITNIFIDFDKYVSIKWFSFNLCILFYVFKNILRKIPQTSLDCQNDLWTKKKKKIANLISKVPHLLNCSVQNLKFFLLLLMLIIHI